MTFDVTVGLALGADLTADSGTWAWTDITDYVLVRGGVRIERGRGGPNSTTTPQRLSLTLDNTDGRFCMRNPTGAYYGTINRNTPIRVRIDPGSGAVARYLGFVDQWPPRFDPSLNHRYVPITASGVLRRLERGQAMRSALYRAHAIQLYSAASSPRAYWPCEDESGANTIASGLSGGFPMSYTNVALGSDSDIAGSDPLMVLESGANFSGVVAPHASTGEWAIRCVMRIPSAPASTVYPFGWYCSGTLPVWRLAIVPGSPDVLRLEAFNSSSVEVLGDTGIDLESTDGGFYDRQLYVEVDVTQNGADIDWSTGIWYNHTSGSGRSGTEATVTAGTVTGVALTGTSGATGCTIGHIAVADDNTYGATSFGATGFAGETTNSRLVRLAAELDIGWGGVSTRNTYMGPQPKAQIVELLREVEAAESGVMYEAMTAAGIVILPREDRENRDVDLALDFDSGHIAPPFDPTDDDFGLYNDVEVDSGGTRGRHVDTAHIAKNGVIEQRVSLNLYGSENPAHHASWRVHVGTVEDLRYPRISLQLHRNTSLIADWLTCDIGSRITIANPPPGLPPDDIDVHVEGYTETFTTHTWDVVLNTSPALPWQVATAAAGLEADTTSELLVGYASGDTSLLIAHPDLPRGLLAPPLWSTTAEPYDWEIAGEQVTATAVVTNLASFVAAGTAAHDVNASVTPSLPAGVQKGDLLLVFAAIRNSGTGTVNTPSGYTELLDFGNMSLFGKIHSGTESAPAVSFTGGAAGADTSAQMAAFRNTQNEVQTSATVLNGSAQNITYPALTGVDRNNLVILYLGWKQDDWTSVTGPGSEIGEPDTATGDDHGLVWAYQIQTTVTEIATGSFTVTGGANAISRGAVVAIKGDVQTATVTRSVNGVTKSQSAGTAVKLWRPTAIAL